MMRMARAVAAVSIFAALTAQADAGVIPPKPSTAQVTPRAPVPATATAKPTFSTGNYPDAVISGYAENRGDSHADGTLTLEVRNHGTTRTDPVWVSVKDDNLLMAEDTPRVAVPALTPGQHQSIQLHVKAQLAGATYAQWLGSYYDKCGTNFRLVLDWHGPVSQTPANDHVDVALKEASGFDQPSQPICDETQCVVLCTVANALNRALNGHATGYAFYIGRETGFISGSGGLARTTYDGDTKPFLPSTKMTVASVSKLVTTIATVRLLDRKHISLDAAIGPYLPDNWNAGAYIRALTFRQLLSQTTGIKDYGNTDQAYLTLKTFFTQPVNPAWTTACPTTVNQNPLPAPINPSDRSYCYSNYNFAILRILLPKIAGFAEDPSKDTRPATLAAQYIQIVQQNEFDLVGRPGVTCVQPAGNSYALAHLDFGKGPGYDWGDNSLGCGAAGWYLSVDDIAAVMISLNAGDNRILPRTLPHLALGVAGGLGVPGGGGEGKDLFQEMKDGGLGFDVANPTANGVQAEYEKNGGWSHCATAGSSSCNQVSTSVAVFGPGVVGVLFIDSDVANGDEFGKGAAAILQDAYYGALTKKPKS